MICEGIFTFLSKIMHFTAFVGNSGSFPHPLSKTEERELIILAQKGDNDARDKLIRHNLRLVVHIVKKYNAAQEADDMISVGTIGLIKAVGTFSLDKGTQLATYAAKCIENEILMYIRSNKKHNPVQSLSEPVGRDCGSDSDITLQDILPSMEIDTALQVENEIMSKKALALMPKLLDWREYKVIRLRYGLGCESLTQREVANKLRISRSYISRIEKRALEKLKAGL